MPKNSNFRLPRGHRFFAKNGSYGYGAKSQWGPCRVHLGANGVPLGPKNGSKSYKITMPQNSIFRLPRDHRFFKKNGIYGYGDKSPWGPPRVHLWANGVPLGPKNGSKPQKVTMPKNSNFRLPRDHRFFAKNGSYGYGAKSSCGSRGVYIGDNGVRRGQKNGSELKKITMPENSYFQQPRGHRFFVKSGSYGYGAKSRWGHRRVHHGANGSHWVQKIGQKSRKLPCPKIRIFDYPAVIEFLQKMEVTVIAPNQDGDPVGSILGPMGSHWVQKMGQNRKKLPCPKIRIFDYPAIIDFSEKMEVTVMATNHCGDHVGSIYGPMGSHWIQKMGQNRK